MTLPIHQAEADRCLLCKKPKCQMNCPIDTPIPRVISLYKEGKIKEAGEVLVENNPLSIVCSMVCVHEDQCKGNCVLGSKGDPIAFHKIEEEISSFITNFCEHAKYFPFNIMAELVEVENVTILYIKSEITNVTSTDKEKITQKFILGL